MSDKTLKPADNLIATIKEGMTSLGWSESKLAREAGVAQSTVNLWLSGKRGLAEASETRITGAVEKGLSKRTAALEAELAAKKEDANSIQRRLSPEAAARIRAAANRRLAEEDAISMMKLANSVLFAAGRYIGPDTPDGVEAIASDRIHREYERFLELMKAGHPSEEVCKGLGLYIARLELLYARSERRIADLEKELEQERQRK